MIRKDSRVTFYGDEDHEFDGTVTDMLEASVEYDTGSVLVQFDEDPPGKPELVSLNELEEM